MNYNTLIFDAFDTVVHINLNKLPMCEVDGKEVQSTAPAVHEAYCARFGKLDFDVFFRAFSQSFAEVVQIRRSEWKEVRSQDRMRALLRILGHPAEGMPQEILESMTEAHMRLLEETFEVRPETLEVLDWASQNFRIGMISNFDYAPALHAALDRFGIKDAFETVVISVEVGWRKPHRGIFDHTLERMGITAKDALFIGDQLYVDVYGAANAGIDSAWIETERQDWLIPGLPEPTYKIRSLTELVKLLENKS